MTTWEYCTVETFVTDWSGANSPRGVVLRQFSDPPRDFQSINEALAEMGRNGWECFSIEKSPPPIIMFQTVVLRFKRPVEVDR